MPMNNREAPTTNKTHTHTHTHNQELPTINKSYSKLQKQLETKQKETPMKKKNNKKQPQTIKSGLPKNNQD